MMTDSALPPERISLGLRAGGLLALAAATAWLILSTYQTPAARECTSLYRAATTGAERARVTAYVPDVPGNRRPEAHSCGFMNSTARWGL